MDSVKVFDLIQPEARVWTKLERALEHEGVPMDSTLVGCIIDFAKAVAQLQTRKTTRSKRDLENNLKFRLNTIRRLTEQLERDRPTIDDLLGSDFLDRQLYFALFEKATLIFERSEGLNFRDSSSLDDELLKLINYLKLLKIAKPAETLASAILRSDILENTWTSRTIQNKISRAVEVGKNRKSRNGDSPVGLAAIFLQKELPDHAAAIAELSRLLLNMKDADLYAIVPKHSRLVFSNLFDDVVGT